MVHVISVGVCALIIHYTPSISTETSEPKFYPVRVTGVDPAELPKGGSIADTTVVAEGEKVTALEIVLSPRTISISQILSELVPVS